MVFVVLSQKLMVLMNPKDEEEEEEGQKEVNRMQTDITDEEMALRYKKTVTDCSFDSVTETPAENIM